MPNAIMPIPSIQQIDEIGIWHLALWHLAFGVTDNGVFCPIGFHGLVFITSIYIDFTQMSRTN